MIFVDTSAFYAVLDKDDLKHREARGIMLDLLTSEKSMITSNYIVVETFSLVHNRLGLKAVRAFQDDILPVVNMRWVDAETHKAGVSVFLTASRRKLSLVDCVSFEIMRQSGIKDAFSFDPHFREQGFRCLD